MTQLWRAGAHCRRTFSNGRSVCLQSSGPSFSGGGSVVGCMSMHPWSRYFCNHPACSYWCRNICSHSPYVFGGFAQPSSILLSLIISNILTTHALHLRWPHSLIRTRTKIRSKPASAGPGSEAASRPLCSPSRRSKVCSATSRCAMGCHMFDRLAGLRATESYLSACERAVASRGLWLVEGRRKVFL